MTIVILTLIVVCALCGAAVLAMFAHSACTHALEPELLVFNEPLTEGIDYDEADETLAPRATGEPA